MTSIYVTGVCLLPLSLKSNQVGQEWKEDASNQEPVYQRNRIRLQLVPLLTELIGGEDALHGRFEALAEQSEQLSSMLDDACEEAGDLMHEYTSACMSNAKQLPPWRFKTLEYMKKQANACIIKQT